MENYLYKDQVYAYHFFRLLQRAEQVVLIYDNDTSSGNLAEKSRFVAQLEFEVRERGLDTLEQQKEFMRADIRKFNSEMPGFKRLTDYEMTDREFEKSTTKKIQRFKIAAAQNK